MTHTNVARGTRNPAVQRPPSCYAACAADTIFRPYGRAANAARRNLPGMGLGLYICRSIVERHGGQIVALSEGEGRGTTLAVKLPTHHDADLLPPVVSA